MAKAVVLSHRRFPTIKGVLHNLCIVIANPDFSVDSTVYRDEAILN